MDNVPLSSHLPKSYFPLNEPILTEKELLEFQLFELKEKKKSFEDKAERLFVTQEEYETLVEFEDTIDSLEKELVKK